MSEPTAAGQVRDFLKSLAAEWVYPFDTVDTFKFGGRESVVTRIAVGWFPFTWALEESIRLGCSLFVTHEPHSQRVLERLRGPSHAT